MKLPGIFGGKTPDAPEPERDPLPPVDKFEDGGADRQAVIQTAANLLQPIANTLGHAFAGDVAGHYKDAGRAIDLVKADVERLLSHVTSLATTYRSR